MVDIGWADGAAWRERNDIFFAQYQAGELDLTAYVDFSTSVWRSRPLEQALQAREQFMREVMAPAMRDNARALVREHQDRGDLVAIVTATNEFVTAPIAQAFGVQHLIAVELEKDEAGHFQGVIRGVPSFQGGKITRVEQWLSTLGHALQDFEQVHFYSDSINDLPLLERVSHPVATNPTPALEQVARARDWRILNLFA